MKHIESAYQTQVVEWSRWAYKANPSRYPMLNMLHCSLNGVKLSGTQAKVAKGQGMLSGVPDLFLPVPKNGFHGLFIEMKSEKGRVTENQHWFLTNADSVGYKTVICYSAKEAISAIEAYYTEQ
ncbi:MAG TPA: VRR-NUC domain-containing protein [Agitococcus sp.]|nr:VRR-NUC domain-containing protein [Agitococcus sp.]